MTEALLIPPAGAADHGDGHEPYRPASPGRGVGRRLRSIAGVDEDILDWVPEERPRYARLGAIVANTGLLAALSMLVLLSSVVDTPWPLLIPVAAIWGYLILSFDGWLVSSTHGVLGLSKLRVLLPRLAISILMSAVIAEPLLLWLLSPAIHTEVRDQREEQITAYEGDLVRCNPVSGASAEGCDKEFRINIGDTLTSVRQELDRAIDEREDLEAEVRDIEATIEDMERLARAECSGQSGEGLTGVRGEGPNCRRDRERVDQFREDSNLQERHDRLDELDAVILQRTEDEAVLSGGYASDVTQAIADRVADMRDNQRQISLLDEDRALGALASESAFVMVGQWLLRLLLIAIDSLPVLTKLMSRNTTYDVLYSRQLEVANRLHEQDQNVREQRTLGFGEVELQRNAQAVRARIEDIDEADRATRANREAVLDAQIEELAARLRNDPGI